jgi:hypothetical protein
MFDKLLWKRRAIDFVSSLVDVYEEYWREFGNSVHPSVYHPELYPENCATLEEWLGAVKTTGRVGKYNWEEVWEQFGKQVDE